MNNLWHLFITLLGSHFGTATNFSAHDTGNPVPYAACLHRDIRDTDLIVAHQTLPCNSKILIYNFRNKRHVIARVGDRGPRHAMVDLNVAVTKVLKANGMEIVWILPLVP